MPPPIDEDDGSRHFVSLREIMITLAGLVLVVLTLIIGRASAMVVLVTSSNATLPFPDIEATFAPRVPATGISGMIYAAEPLDACEPLVNDAIIYALRPLLDIPTFVVVERGTCTFETKVRNAQQAGFSAIVVYNDEDDRDLVSMSGNSDGIQIPAVFVSKAAGEAFLKYAGDMGARLYILPAIENTAWSVMAVSLISLLAVTAVLATFFFVRRYRLRHLGSRLLLLRESLGMSSREVKALPTAIYKSTSNTSETCAICLEDYESGEKLRILPCHHDFHAACVDQWLTTQRPFCPVCKRDAHNKSQEPPPSESTPLLAPAAAVSVPIVTSQAATQTSPVGSFPRGLDNFEGSRASSLSASPSNSVEARPYLLDSHEVSFSLSSIGSPVDPSGQSLGFHSAPETFLNTNSSVDVLSDSRSLHNASNSPNSHVGDQLC